MTKAASIYSFWEKFLTSYEENSVPDDAEFPYITYQFIEDSFGIDLQMTASLWYRSSSWVNINKMTDLISNHIGRGGIFLPCDGGKIWIRRGIPFAQNMGDESDDLIKRKYLNVTVEFLTAD
jgi:hypothetical protein